MFRKTGGGATGYWPALFRACGILIVIATLAVGSRDKVKVETAQVFFSKSGTSSHTLHYSNIKQDFDLKGPVQDDREGTDRGPDEGVELDICAATAQQRVAVGVLYRGPHPRQQK